MRKRRKKEPSKYEKDAVIVDATISRIDFINMEIGDKYKSVFYCPSYLEPEGRMCVFWGMTNLEIGDTVQMKGRFNDGVFLVWSLIIIKKASKQNVEVFETERDFNKKFPGKLYVCPHCGSSTTNPYTCTECRYQITGFLHPDKVYAYKIGSGEVTKIFKPVEIFRESDEAQLQTQKS